MNTKTNSTTKAQALSKNKKHTKWQVFENRNKHDMDEGQDKMVYTIIIRIMVSIMIVLTYVANCMLH
jgi:hypothetical protein